MEKSTEISIRDHEELRDSQINRMENIVIRIIENLFEGVLPKISYKIATIDTLMEQIKMQIYPRTIDDGESCQNSSMLLNDDESIDFLENPDSGIFESLGDEKTVRSQDSRRYVELGTRNNGEKFALLMKTMAKIHRLLVNNRTETRRSFYYELKSSSTTNKLISNQKQIDKIVNIVANLLDCAPWDMALVASAKGLGSGDLILTLDNDEKIDYSSKYGALIPTIVSNVKSLRSRAKLVLIVEKDAVFHKLLQDNCPRVLNCIMITGKGYPDVATRMLVKILAEKLKLPVYVLVDANPYGIEIMLTYKFGSINLSYERESLACPTVRWLGLRPSEIESMKISTIPMTKIDLAKLEAVNSRPYVTESVSRELQIMRRGKAEIEAITIGSEECNNLAMFYIRRKIQDADYI